MEESIFGLVFVLSVLSAIGVIFALRRKRWFTAIVVAAISFVGFSSPSYWARVKAEGHFPTTDHEDQRWAEVGITATQGPPGAAAEPNWLLRKWNDVFSSSGEQQPLPLSRSERERGNPDLASRPNYKGGRACGEVKTPLKPDDVVTAQVGQWSGPVNLLRKFAIEYEPSDVKVRWTDKHGRTWEESGKKDVDWGDFGISSMPFRVMSTGGQPVEVKIFYARN